MFVPDQVAGRALAGKQGGTAGVWTLVPAFWGREVFVCLEEAAPMTVPLYHTDAHVKTFDAVVTAVEGQAVALDRTAFYPGGGGQPNDLGTLTFGGQTWAVTKVRKAGADIWHEL